MYLTFYTRAEKSFALRNFSQPGFVRAMRGKAFSIESIAFNRREPQLVLPAGFSNARDLALVSQLAEADTADTEITQVSVRTAADLAAVVLTSRELRSLLLLEYHCLLSH